ncbi:MAG: OmpA family protein [Oligoflexia bacterium]|nr:OmpA family protein [Oligoflexia bacterium]
MSKKRHAEEHENHERWLVSYADFITLLFAFFTVLYATSQQDVSKAQEFQRSIQKSFKSFLDFGGTDADHVGYKDNTQFLEPPIDVVPQEGGFPEHAAPPSQAGTVEMQDYMERELGKEGLDIEEMEEMTFRTDSEGLKVSLAGSSFFDPGMSKIRREALPVLDKLARVLRATKKNLVIQGHTDDTPVDPDGEFPSNWELSAARAATVIRYFIAIHKIPGNRFTAVGYADTRPVASTMVATPEQLGKARAKNRRIDILIPTEIYRPNLKEVQVK